MNVIVDNDALLFNYFLQQRLHIDALLKPIKDDAGEYVNHRVLKDQFEDRARWIIIADMCLHLKLGVDVVKAFVDTINIHELLLKR